MFVTLKSSKANSDGVGMEQVARTSARQASARNRFGTSRRDACTGCRSKKLRCTGSRISCDRCHAQGIPCVFPTMPRLARVRHGRVGSQTCQPQSSTGNSDTMRDDTQEQQSEIIVSRISQPRPEFKQRLGGSTCREAPQVTHLLSDSELEQQDVAHSAALDRPSLKYVNTAVSTQDTSLELGRMAVSNITPPGDTAIHQEVPGPCTLVDLPDSLHSNGSPPFPGLAGLNTNSKPSETNSTSSIDGSLSCSCIEDMLDIVQKLDDDEFKLRTLGFDEVLKVQKWLLFHCCKPLDCPKCENVPAASTVILIICERIANMFRCLSRRIKRQLLETSQSQGLNAIDPPDRNPPSRHSTSSPELLPMDDTTSAQLFDDFSGNTSMGTICNPDMFSPQFKEQYSYEEQLHMIRVLAKIQVRNFNQLLLRISEMHQSQRSQARFGKILDLINRLQKAAESIDSTFQRMLQNLVS